MTYTTFGQEGDVSEGAELHWLHNILKYRAKQLRQKVPYSHPTHTIYACNGN
jgi:hypothetical protein